MTKAEIKVILDESEINYTSKMTLNELKSLLPTDNEINEEEVVVVTATSNSTSFDVRIKRKINLFVKQNMTDGVRETRQIYVEGDVITDVHPNHKEMCVKWSSHIEIL